MAATVTRVCACGNEFEARQADVNRGWAKSCSKACAAIRREGATVKSSTRSNSECKKERRCNILRQALEDERISEEYFYLVLRSEYPEFMTADEDMEAIDVLDGPFGEF